VFCCRRSPVETQQKADGKRKGSTVGAKQAKKRKLDVSPNALDVTWIHPESYELTDKCVCLSVSALYRSFGTVEHQTCDQEVEVLSAV